jgi:hypothetical protein
MSIYIGSARDSNKKDKFRSIEPGTLCIFAYTCSAVPEPLKLRNRTVAGH